MKLDVPRSAFPARRGLITPLLLLLGVHAACGGPAGDDDAVADVDAATALDASDPDANACDAVGGPGARSAPLPLDGVYAAVSGDANGIPADCWSDDNGATYKRAYLALANGQVRAYRRVFVPGELCGLAPFDTGGWVEEVGAATWTGCGPTYDTADGVFQQFVSIDQLDSAPLRWHRFMGAGPSAPRWRELIVSTVTSSTAFDAPPPDLRFRRYRAPR